MINEGNNGITKDEIVSGLELIQSKNDFYDSQGLVGISGRPIYLKEKNSNFLEGKILFAGKNLEENFIDFWTSENSYLTHIIKYVKSKNESMFFQLENQGEIARVYGGSFLDHYYLVIDEKNALTNRGFVERTIN